MPSAQFPRPRQNQNYKCKTFTFNMNKKTFVRFENFSTFNFRFVRNSTKCFELTDKFRNINPVCF